MKKITKQNKKKQDKCDQTKEANQNVKRNSTCGIHWNSTFLKKRNVQFLSQNHLNKIIKLRCLSFFIKLIKKYKIFYVSVFKMNIPLFGKVIFRWILKVEFHY